VGNVIVPSHLYKVVYSPRQNAAAAYFVANEADARYETISVAELEGKVGINLLPALSARQKETMLRLPRPKGKS
jgi:endonuclease G